MTHDEARQEIRRLVYKEQTGDIYVDSLNELISLGLEPLAAVTFLKDLYWACSNDYGN